MLSLDICIIGSFFMHKLGQVVGKKNEKGNAYFTLKRQHVTVSIMQSKNKRNGISYIDKYKYVYKGNILTNIYMIILCHLNIDVDQKE